MMKRIKYWKNKKPTSLGSGFSSLTSGFWTLGSGLSFLFLLLFSFQSKAQNYPVQVSVITTGPFYNYASYYADAKKHLRFIITLTDFNSGPVNVRLRLKMEGNGYALQTNPNFPVGPVLSLTPGLPVFVEGEDLLPYFQENNLIKSPSSLDLNNLPFGFTTVCAEVVKVGVGNEILATNNCSAFLLNSFQPAISTSPFCGSFVDPANPFISFLWTQPIGYTPAPGLDLNYTFSLFEWIDTTNFSVFQSVQSLVLQEQTSVPLVNFSTYDYPLQLGKKYIWRTQAQVSSNGNLVQMFDNQGFSAPCSFTYGQAISLEEQLAAGLEIDLTASANSPVRGQAQWTVTQTNPSGGGLSTYSSYILDYRKKPTGNEGYVIPWFSDSTASSFLDIYQLQDSTTYEVKIRGRVGNFTSDFSEIVEFTTPPKRIYACGEADLPVLPTNYNPLSFAEAGMTVRIGQFDLMFTEVTPTGAPGHFAGKGLVPIDFIGGAKAKVRFADLLIDDQFNVRSGAAEVVTDGLDNWLNQQYQQFIDPIYVTGTIDSAYVSNGMAWVMVNGVPQSFAFDPPDYPVIIRDDSGMEYKIYPDGTVVVSSYLDISNDVLNANASTAIVFQQNMTEKFGFDPKEHMEWADQYELIKLLDNSNYFVPNKSLGENEGDKVDFKFNDSLWTASDIYFKLDNDSLSLLVTATGNLATVTLPSNLAKGKYKFYAMADGLKLGKLNLEVFEEKTKEVVIVPLVANYNYTAANIEAILDSTFGEANMEVDVTIAGQWNDAVFTTSHAMQVPEEVGLLNKYSQEMRDLRDAYFDDTNALYKEKAYYLFVVPSFSDPNLDGYMVRGKGLGFVANNADLLVYAHELGHGIGALEHSWNENGPAQGSTNNLMDYAANAKELTLDQWKELRSFDLLPSLMDEQTDGSQYSVNIAYLEPLSNANSFSFIAPNGSVISIPKSASRVHFSTLDRFIELFSEEESNSLAPVGSILSFDLNGKNYAYTGGSFYERNEFGDVLPINSAKYSDTLTSHDNPSKVITSFFNTDQSKLKATFFLTDTANFVPSSDSWIIFDNGTIPLNSGSIEYINHYVSAGTSKIQVAVPPETFGVDVNPIIVYNAEFDKLIPITPFTIFEVSPAFISVEYFVKYLLLCNYKKNDFALFAGCVGENLWTTSPMNFGTIVSCTTCVNLTKSNYRSSSESMRAYFQESLEAAFDMSDLNQFNELSAIVESGTLDQIKTWIKSKPSCLIRFMPSQLRAKTFVKLMTNDSYWKTALYLIEKINTDDPNLVNQFINHLADKSYGDWLQLAYPQLSEFWEPDGSDFHQLKEIFCQMAKLSAEIPSNSHFSNTTFTRNIYRTSNPLTETPATFSYTALDQPIFFTKSMISTAGNSQDAIKVKILNYSGNDGVTISYTNGKIYVQQHYEIWDASLVYTGPDYVATKLEYDVNYALNPYENITVQFLDNYASELGFDKGESVVVPAYFLVLYKESIDHANWHSNFRFIGNAAMVAAAISAPLTLGGSLVILGGLVAAHDIDIQADKANATQAEINALNDWEEFYNIAMLVSTAPAVYKLFNAVAAPNRLMRLQMAYTNGYNSLTKIPTTVKNSLVKIREVIVGGVSTAGRFIATSGTELKTYLDDLVTLPAGKPYNGQFYKSINTDFHPSPNPQLIDDYATLNLDHRYSKVGESGYYVSQTNTGNLSEMGFSNGVPANYQRYRYDNVSINNMLYLTDDAVRQQLGITDDMIKKLGEGKYEYTHVLGTWAKDHYKGIVYPGAQGGNYTNIIIFKQVDVDNALGGLIANPL